MTEKKKRTALVILLAVFLFSTSMMFRQQAQYRQIIADGGEAAQTAGLRKPQEQPRRESAPVRSPEPEGPEPLPEEAEHLSELDLEALRTVNEDVAGWIEIPGTELSYPLLQGTDNQFYLSHNWKGEGSVGGAVFLESTSSPDLTDFHTIAYAHRMRNGSMFATLKYYNKLDYWQEHPRVYVVRDDAIYRYDIFSAQEAGVKGIVYRLDIEEGRLEEEFLQCCIENSVIDTGLTPEADDCILTLSTCTGSGRAARWVVHAVLAQTYQRPEAELRP